MTKSQPITIIAHVELFFFMHDLRLIFDVMSGALGALGFLFGDPGLPLGVLGLHFDVDFKGKSL